MAKIPTGTEVLDKLLEGGFESDVITTIYGPPGSGKTTTCLLAALATAAAKENKEKKVVFIDTEGGFSTERLQQLAGDQGTARKAMERIMLLKATDFAEQKKYVETLSEAGPKICLIICDTISSLYRIERGDDNMNLNRELGKQLGTLLTVARTKDIPVIISTPVYADFSDSTKIKLVGGDILKYSSKCLVELRINPNGTRTAILIKHSSIPEKQVVFKIKEKGFEEV